MDIPELLVQNWVVNSFVNGVEPERSLILRCGNHWNMPGTGGYAHTFIRILAEKPRWRQEMMDMVGL